MKVLYSMIYAPEKGGSGAPIYVHTLLKEMYKKGYKSGIVFSTDQAYKEEQQNYYDAYPLRFARPPIFDDQPKVPFSIPFKDMEREQVETYIKSFYDEFTRLLTLDTYDLLHIQHGMYIGYAAALIKEKLHVPYIISLHVMELNFLHEFPDPLYAMKAMTDADVILALTDAQKKRLLSEYTYERIIELEQRQHHVSKNEAIARYVTIIGDKKIDPANVIVCPLGIDTNLFKIRKNFPIPQQLADLHLPQNAKMVFFAGRLIEMKGIRYLLEAEKIYNKHQDVYTVIVGGGKLEDLVKKASMSNPFIHYLGFVDQKEMPFYHNFMAQFQTVFCVPSSSEGMSLVYLEAMNSGMCVVACCKKDMGELDFMQSPNAVFAKFANPKSIAECIISLHEKKIVKQDVSRLVKKYNVDNFFNRVLYTYDIVLGQ